VTWPRHIAGAAVLRADLADSLSEKRKDRPAAASLLGVIEQLFAYGVEMGRRDRVASGSRHVPNTQNPQTGAVEAENASLLLRSLS
jgi:hypothetical protein